eukprot:6184205-Pleurochrysis_carterae.AAC.2
MSTEDPCSLCEFTLPEGLSTRLREIERIAPLEQACFVQCSERPSACAGAATDACTTNTLYAPAVCLELRYPPNEPIPNAPRDRIHCQT